MTAVLSGQVDLAFRARSVFMFTTRERGLCRGICSTHKRDGSFLVGREPNLILSGKT